MTNRGRPKIPESLTKKQVLQIRLLEGEKQGFEEAAESYGLSLSSWARTRLREAARKDLRAVDKKADKFF